MYATLRKTLPLEKKEAIEAYIAGRCPTVSVASGSSAHHLLPDGSFFSVTCMSACHIRIVTLERPDVLKELAPTPTEEEKSLHRALREACETYRFVPSDVVDLPDKAIDIIQTLQCGHYEAMELIVLNSIMTQRLYYRSTKYDPIPEGVLELQAVINASTEEDRARLLITFMEEHAAFLCNLAMDRDAVALWLSDHLLVNHPEVLKRPDVKAAFKQLTDSWSTFSYHHFLSNLP